MAGDEIHLPPAVDPRDVVLGRVTVELDGLMRTRAAEHGLTHGERYQIFAWLLSDCLAAEMGDIIRGQRPEWPDQEFNDERVGTGTAEVQDVSVLR